MVDRTTNVTNFSRTTLTSSFGPSDLTATVESTSGFPAAPFIAVFEFESQARREVVLFDTAGTGTTFVTSDIGNRYLSGSAAGSGITHPAGSVVTVAPLAQHIQDLNDRVDTVTDGFDTHKAAANPHSESASSSDLTAHTAAVNPHSGSASTSALTSHTGSTSAHSATASATENRLVLRDSSGRAKVADPSVAADIATKGYIDSTAGASVATPSTLVRRDVGGRFRAVDPSNAADVATKGYVDANGSGVVVGGVTTSTLPSAFSTGVTVFATASGGPNSSGGVVTTSKAGTDDVVQMLVISSTQDGALSRFAVRNKSAAGDVWTAWERQSDA